MPVYVASICLGRIVIPRVIPTGFPPIAQIVSDAIYEAIKGQNAMSLILTVPSSESIVVPNGSARTMQVPAPSNRKVESVVVNLALAATSLQCGLSAVSAGAASIRKIIVACKVTTAKLAVDRAAE